MTAIAVPVPTKKEAGKFLHIIFYILIFVLLMFGIYWFFIKPKVNIKTIRQLIGDESKKYNNPVETQKILLSGVNDILFNPEMIKQARIYASTAQIAIENVLVANAVSMAKQYGYITEVLPKTT